MVASLCVGILKGCRRDTLSSKFVDREMDMLMLKLLEEEDDDIYTSIGTICTARLIDKFNAILGCDGRCGQVTKDGGVAGLGNDHMQKITLFRPYFVLVSGNLGSAKKVFRGVVNKGYSEAASLEQFVNGFVYEIHSVRKVKGYEDLTNDFIVGSTKFTKDGWVEDHLVWIDKEVIAHPVSTAIIGAGSVYIEEWKEDSNWENKNPKKTIIEALSTAVLKCNEKCGGVLQILSVSCARNKMVTKYIHGLPLKLLVKFEVEILAEWREKKLLHLIHLSKEVI